VDEVVKQFERGLQVIAQRPGLERVDIFVNRKSGAGMTVALWETEDALRGSEEAADDLRSEIALELFGWIQTVEEYEVVRSETYT
jgi:hypothetical protein